MDNKVTPISAGKKLTPLQKLKAAGGSKHLDRLNALIQNTNYVMQDMVPVGSLAALIGPQGSAKTLTTLAELGRSCSMNLIDPEKVIYVMEDDNLKGFTEKVAIAEKLGFEVVNSTQTGGDYFRTPAELIDLIEAIADSNEAEGVVIVLDTMKKFVDPGNKGEFPRFASRCRKFNMAGGTIILLGHTNKYQDKNNKWVFAGVADVIQDVDIMYMAYPRTERSEQRQVVVWENEKDRGAVESEVAFEYESLGKEQSYAEMLASVRRSEGGEIKPRWAEIKRKAFDRKFKVLSDMIVSVLSGGAMQKTELTNAVMQADEDLGRDRVRLCIDALTELERLSYNAGKNGALIYGVNGNYDPDAYDWENLPQKYWKDSKRTMGAK